MAIGSWPFDSFDFAQGRQAQDRTTVGNWCLAYGHGLGIENLALGGLLLYVSLGNDFHFLTLTDAVIRCRYRVSPPAAAGAVVESGLGVVAAAATSVDPDKASDQSTVISEQLTANGNGVAPCVALRAMQDEPRDVPFDGAQGKQAAPGRRTPNNDTAPTIDLLMALPDGDISGVQAISGGLSATRLQRAATAGYDLRPLRDDPPTDGQTDDLLADILAESALAVRPLAAWQFVGLWEVR